MNYQQQAEKVLMKTYNRFPIVLDHGDGVYLYDVDDKKYLDFGSGIAVFALGYNQKEYNQALKDQIDKLIHTSNLYYNVPAIEAGTKIVESTGLDKVFFTNSGTEAIEGAIKLARKYAYEKDPTKEYEIIAMEHGFHGRSQGALSVTGTKKYREGMIPKGISAVFATFNDLEDVKNKINEKTCAIITEVVQGEGGIYPAKQEFLTGLRELCDEHDILLIFDEIQCGMGRCGAMYAHELYGVKPDVMTLAKALGCGVPVGAFVASEKCSHTLVPGDHGTTYGGNPLATCAVSKVYDLFEKLNIVDHVKEVGMYLGEKLDVLTQKYDMIKEHRGLGLIHGLELMEQVKAQDVIQKALEHGLIILSAGNNTLRFVPPLIIEQHHIDEMISVLEQCLRS